MSPPNQDSSPQDIAEPQTADNGSRSKAISRPRKVRITRPEISSLYDIMHDHAGASLFVLPPLWTDLHSEVLGVRWNEMPAIDKPVPDHVPGRWLEPSRTARALTSELHILVRPDKTAQRLQNKTTAMKRIMGALFPETLCRPKSNVDLSLYFGDRYWQKAVRVHCVWKTPSSTDMSFDSAPTDLLASTTVDPAVDYAPNKPLLAYMNLSQLKHVRKHMYRPAAPHPQTGKNEPVNRLLHLRSKMLMPADPKQDPYIVSVLLAMAQAHFYKKKGSKSSSQSSTDSTPKTTKRVKQPKFHDIKVQLITHDEYDKREGSDSNFFVYTAVVSAAFLNRFLHPEKCFADAAGDDGLEITQTPVNFWPLLGLKERLAKALGREIAGDPGFGDPDYIALWDQLLDQSKCSLSATYGPPSLKRPRPSRPVLSEVLNSSFEEEQPSSPDDRPVLSPSAKRRRTGRLINPSLEVC